MTKRVLNADLTPSAALWFHILSPAVADVDNITSPGSIPSCFALLSAKTCMENEGDGVTLMKMFDEWLIIIVTS